MSVAKSLKMKMRPLLSHFLGLFLTKSGFVQTQLKKIKSTNSITVLYFHNPSAELFAGCVSWLVDNHYVFITVRELYDIVTQDIAPPVGAVCLTVDDGWRENLSNIMPVVNARNIPICFFISTGPVLDGTFWWSLCAHAVREGFGENISAIKLKKIPNLKRMKIIDELRTRIKLDREAMTKEELIELSRNPLVTIGSHTVNHPCLNQCTDNESVYEITECNGQLSEWIRKDVKYFSYPNGDYKGSEHQVLAECGCLMAFTTKQEFVSPNDSNHFYVPRFSINDRGSLEENICKMIGLWQIIEQFVTGFIGKIFHDSIIERLYKQGITKRKNTGIV